MDHGEGSNTNPKSGQSSVEAANDNNGTTGNNNGKLPQDQLAGRGQDLYMTAMNVKKIMTRVLPPHAQISDDVIETMQESVSQFIHVITSEANKQSRNEPRKIVKADNILVAMENLGLKDYIDPLNAYLDNYRKKESERKTVRGEPSANPSRRR